MQLYEIGAGITGLLLFGAMALTQMSKDWQTPGGWLLVSLVGIPLLVLAIGFAIKNPVLLFGALIFAGFAAGRGFR